MADADLRDRIAAALHGNLKRRTIPPTSDPFNGRIGSFGLTMHELADIALAVVQPELDRLAAVEAAAPDWARDQTGRVMTVHVTTLARKIAEKRDALCKLDEACREVDRLRVACRSTAVLLRASADHRPDPAALRSAAAALDELAGPAQEVPDGA